MIDLAVVDIDGCLTPGVAREWNWSALQSIGDLNRRASDGETVPPVTLCTGRQQPYVEVFMQAIGAYLPAIYENGCGMYFPDGFRFIQHPAISAEVREALAAARSMLHARLVRPGLAYFQPGREASHSLFPMPGINLVHLHEGVSDALSGCNPALSVQVSAACVDVMPFGIDKGAGLHWLSEETGIPLARMGGIGDSAGDLRFLDLVGRSAAPANAAEEVKAAVGYVSVLQDSEGVLDILQTWCSCM